MTKSIKNIKIENTDLLLNSTLHYITNITRYFGYVNDRRNTETPIYAFKLIPYYKLYSLIKVIQYITTNKVLLPQKRKAGVTLYIPGTIKKTTITKNVYKIIDVGGGIGFIPTIMKEAIKNASEKLFKNIEVDSYSLEIDKELIEIGRNIFYSIGHIHKNALYYDQYNQYDLIYLYIPIEEPGKMTTLYKKIFRECKKECIIMPVGMGKNHFDNIIPKTVYNKFEYRSIEGIGIYKKIK